MTMTRHTARDNARGFSLVELLVGMFIGLILIGGVIQMYISNKETDRLRQSMAAISENAQFVFEHMNRHLRMADYEGEPSLTYSTPGGAEVLTAEIYKESNDEVEEVEYRFEDNTILFDGEPLIDGVAGWTLQFGIGDPDDGSIQYEIPVPDSYDNVWSINIELELLDPVNENQPLKLAEEGISSTIAIRNRVFEVAAANLSPVGNGSASGGTPIGDDNGDEEDGDQNGDGDNAGNNGEDDDSSDGDTNGEEDGIDEDSNLSGFDGGCYCRYGSADAGYEVEDSGFEDDAGNETGFNQCSALCCEDNDSGDPDSDDRLFFVPIGQCN